jgi:hypothetical protein
MTDAFSAFAEENKPAHVARKERIAATRKERAAEKAQNEQAEINKIAAAWRRARLEDLKTGPHGADVKALRSFLRAMTLESAQDLVDYVARAQWLRDCDADTSFDCFDMICRAVTSLRMRNGLSPFDDPLGDERNAVLQIRMQLYGF